MAKVTRVQTPPAPPAADGSALVWPEATARLSEDPAFGPLVQRVGPVVLRPPRGDHFQSLAAAIVFQQLAGRAALTIHGRFVEAVGGDVQPETVLAASDEALRRAGLSRNKQNAIRDLAAHVASGTLQLHDIDVLPEEEVIRRLTQVKGIGTWTAEMFLIFNLRRPDIWPTGDLGVRVGLGRVLGFDAAATPEQMKLIGYGYRPWRSAVSWYCWRAVEIALPGI